MLLAGFCVVLAATAMWSRFGGPGTQIQKPAESSWTVPVQDSVASTDAESKPFALTEQQRRGKQIYLTGISPTGATMTAVLGNSRTEVPAGVLTCVNCHRHDGRGKAEGGIYPSNIRWDELTKPYGSHGLRGRTRPPYDVSLLKRSISMGLDSAGKSLDDAMPRYRMTLQDLGDLAAYLMVIGRELDPGLSADRIRIGVVLAPSQLFPEMNLAVRAVLSAYVSDFNREGGVYQREIDLCFSEAPTRREDRADAVINFVKREEVFALTSTFIAGSEAEIARQLGAEGVPLIGAQTLHPQLAFPLNRHLFYLSSGLPGQCRTLVTYALERQTDAGQRGNAVVLFPQDESSGEDHLSDAANAIEVRAASLGWQVRKHQILAREFRAETLARNLKEQEYSCVFSLLSGQQILQLLGSAEACDWFPNCYLPGPIVGPELFESPVGFDKRIFLAFPTLPTEQSAGSRACVRLAQEHELHSSHLSTQFEALSAVETLLEGLRRVGSNLSRERLVEELEMLHEYRTGFTPAVSFGPNRRVGARGAHILTVDLTNKKLVTVSKWVDDSSHSPGF